MAWIFGDFRLDPERFELSCGSELVRLEPQVLALICLLVRHHDRMVTKDEIVDKIWHGQSVSDASISSRIRSARQAVGDDPDSAWKRFSFSGRGCGNRSRTGRHNNRHPRTKQPVNRKAFDCHSAVSTIGDASRACHSCGCNPV